jgi:hypothetical protein
MLKIIEISKYENLDESIIYEDDATKKGSLALLSYNEERKTVSIFRGSLEMLEDMFKNLPKYERRLLKWIEL